MALIDSSELQCSLDEVFEEATTPPLPPFGCTESCGSPFKYSSDLEHGSSQTSLVSRASRLSTKDVEVTRSTLSKGWNKASAGNMKHHDYVNIEVMESILTVCASLTS